MIPADPALSALAPVTAPAPTDAARALIEGQLAMLSRLAQVGMEIAEACGRQATGDEPGEPASRHDPGLVFARVARAVRMTIALQSRLAKDLAALDRAEEQAATARKDRRRMRLRGLIGQAVSAGIDPKDEWGDTRDEDAVEDEIDRLSDEAYERLTDAEDGDLSGRPFDEAVAAICADLGLSPAWTARVTAAVEAPAERVAARPTEPRSFSSPFMGEVAPKGSEGAAPPLARLRTVPDD